MTFVRKYDIGGGVIIEDNGRYLVARIDTEKSKASLGVRRPPVGPLPDELRAIFSLDEKYFYLMDFTDVQGFWLGTKLWTSKEEMLAQIPHGIFGKAHAQFDRTDTGETYYREILHFNSWDVKSHNETRMVSKADEMIRDYLALAQNDDREQGKRFDEFIAPSGRNLKWIIDKIGKWDPAPPEPPPIVLT